VCPHAGGSRQAGKREVEILWKFLFRPDIQYAVALHSTGKADAAIARLEKALVAHPNDHNILEALASFHEARGERASAKQYAERLRAIDERMTRGK